MQTGQTVKVIIDEWNLFGKIGRVLDETIVNGSTRCTVEVEEDILILTPNEMVVAE